MALRNGGAAAVAEKALNPWAPEGLLFGASERIKFHFL